ncbi:ferredoxin:glutaredoxin reductase [Candidatus Bathyarchaeota archaeon]|nr:ferredoxin:glutaredoxin reductase [Candidatus Bathyarchaeota archaeon]
MTTLKEVRKRAEADARTHGYYLNPDSAFLNNLLEGLKQNEERYGYPSCPCRLASGKFEFDRDIICPCDYRDPDIAEYGSCYCGLYVSKEVFEGKKPLQPVPERRPIEKQMKAYAVAPETIETEASTAVVQEAEKTKTSKKLWYCRQCGYVVFREDPPYVCPICQAKREMFAEISLHISLS